MRERKREEEIREKSDIITVSKQQISFIRFDANIGIVLGRGEMEPQ